MGIQTDNILGLSDSRFSEKEVRELEKAGFTVKAVKQLTEATLITFHSGIIRLTGNNILL